MQDSNQPIVVALSADDNYAMPMAVTLRSLLSNLAADKTIQVYVLDGGIKADSKQKPGIIFEPVQCPLSEFSECN
jgi:lipopolysaccharide biosynthesis glycosyltransferase